MPIFHVPNIPSHDLEAAKADIAQVCETNVCKKIENYDVEVPLTCSKSAVKERLTALREDGCCGSDYSKCTFTRKNDDALIGNLTEFLSTNFNTTNDSNSISLQSINMQVCKMGSNIHTTNDEHKLEQFVNANKSTPGIILECGTIKSTSPLQTNFSGDVSDKVDINSFIESGSAVYRSKYGANSDGKFTNSLNVLRIDTDEGIIVQDSTNTLVQKKKENYISSDVVPNLQQSHLTPDSCARYIKSKSFEWGSNVSQEHFVYIDNPIAGYCDFGKCCLPIAKSPEGLTDANIGAMLGVDIYKIN